MCVCVCCYLANRMPNKCLSVGVCVYLCQSSSMLTNNNNYFLFPLHFLWAILTEQNKKTSSKTTNSTLSLITRHSVNWNGGSISNYCVSGYVRSGWDAKQMRREFNFRKSLISMLSSSRSNTKSWKIGINKTALRHGQNKQNLCSHYESLRTESSLIISVNSSKL